jgi:hypothetical protein
VGPTCQWPPFSLLPLAHHGERAALMLSLFLTAESHRTQLSLKSRAPHKPAMSKMMSTTIVMRTWIDHCFFFYSLQILHSYGVLSVFSAMTNNRVYKITWFQFRGGLTNKQTHKSLYWFRPLSGGNSPTSSMLILSKNRCYKGWGECSNGSHVKGGLDLVPCAWRVGVIL